MHSLGKSLKLPLTLNYVGFDEDTFDHFTHAMSHPCVGIQLLAEPQGQTLLLDMDYSLTRMLVDRLLGGEGAPPQELIPLTPTEEGVLEFFLVKALSGLPSVGVGDLPHSLKFGKIVFENKLLGGSEAGAERGCVFKFYLGMGKKGGYVKIYVPHPLLEGLFLREAPLAGPNEGADFERHLGRVSHVKAPLWTEIGRVQLMPSDLEQLETEDVILFDETLASMSDHGVTGQAILRVGDAPRDGLLAEVVDAEGKLVVKVLDYYGGD